MDDEKLHVPSKPGGDAAHSLASSAPGRNTSSPHSNELEKTDAHSR